MYKYFKINNM